MLICSIYIVVYVIIYNIVTYPYTRTHTDSHLYVSMKPAHDIAFYLIRDQ